MLSFLKCASFIPALPCTRYFASKAQAGSTTNGRDSIGKRLGIKRYGGEEVIKNEIIVRQRGLRFCPGDNIIVGRDHTLHAATEGVVHFTDHPFRANKKIVHILPKEIPNRMIKPPPPFNYHPELYPEEAKKNITFEEIRNRMISIRKQNI